MQCLDGLYQACGLRLLNDEALEVAFGQRLDADVCHLVLNAFAGSAGQRISPNCYSDWCLSRVIPPLSTPFTGHLSVSISSVSFANSFDRYTRAFDQPRCILYINFAE